MGLRPNELIPDSVKRKVNLGNVSTEELEKELEKTKKYKE